MTFLDWLIIVAIAATIVLVAIAATIVLVTKRVNAEADSPDPPTPDRGGVPRRSEQLRADIACEIRNGLELPKKTYPIGMHYQPNMREELLSMHNNSVKVKLPIVPKRRKPRTGGKGFHRLTVGFPGEEYHFIFPAAMNPSDVMIAAHEWAENPELAFNGRGEDAVLDLLIERESMRE